MSDSTPIISVEYSGDAIVVTPIYEEIMQDIEIKKLSEAIWPLIDDEKNINFVFDFTEVKSVSSSALGLLIKLKKSIDKKNGKMKLCCICGKVQNSSNDKYVYEILKIVKLDTFFDICENVEEALQKFK